MWLFILCLLTLSLHASQENSLIKRYQENKINAQRLLMDSIFERNIEGVTYALDSGEVNLNPLVSFVPLIEASSSGCVDIVKLLLSHGAYVNHKDSDNKTALIVAADRGRFGVVMTLLRAGARAIVHYGRCGWTPLHCATQSNFHDIIHALLRHDTDMMLVKSNDGGTPLHLAIEKMFPSWPFARKLPVDEYNQRFSTVKILLFYAYQKNKLFDVLTSKNCFNQTPKDMAFDADDLVKFLDDCMVKKPCAIKELLDCDTRFEYAVLQEELKLKHKNLTVLLSQREITGRKIKY